MENVVSGLNKEIQKYDEWSYAYSEDDTIHVCNDGVCDSLVYDMCKHSVVYENETGTIDDKLLAFIARSYLRSKSLL